MEENNENGNENIDLNNEINEENIKDEINEVEEAIEKSGEEVEITAEEIKEEEPEVEEPVIEEPVVVEEEIEEEPIVVEKNQEEKQEEIIEEKEPEVKNEETAKEDGKTYKRVEIKKAKKKSKFKNFMEWVYCIVIAIVLALAFRYYIGTPTVVQQPSMNYTLEEGQRLILSRWTRTIKGTYNRGDIITFEAPKADLSAFEINQENPKAIYEYEPKGILEKFTYYVLEFNKTSYIKRVIGVAGDHVKIMDGKVYLNDEELKEDYLGEGIATLPGNYSDIIVPEGYVFVMGDNRPHSKDSRAFGCIPVEKIESKVVLRFWPFDKFGNVK